MKQLSKYMILFLYFSLKTCPFQVASVQKKMSEIYDTLSRLRTLVDQVNFNFFTYSLILQ